MFIDIMTVRHHSQLIKTDSIQSVTKNEETGNAVIKIKLLGYNQYEVVTIKTLNKYEEIKSKLLEIK